ncbi:[citrate (pro-3S)-lyase] ligase [Cedecea davisae]|uniref:[Citrate [pro-3S]-lyase] ligase n=1 Tax=Cedecea davisae TaxID=158484 RepID=A0ABS6DG49_9ENTR|nr:[citrate (pro-3S)-lyase] ligase [Cedecea davisae]MBU4682060.1 [citrate (pro-3S)-lyase] ligase [Cedecea davisae]MBU4689422.1 [citrate (pro-3S)-lyase] ligase [Cedecea davisae]
MYHSNPIEFRTVDPLRQPQELAAIRELLECNQLGLDGDIQLFVVAAAGRRIVGCAGLAWRTIKCVAVDEAWRGDNLSVRLLGEIQHIAMERGNAHLFLFTRPHNLERFRQGGFWPLVQVDETAVLMENTPIGISRYCTGLEKKRKPGSRIGSIVMNANPFTLGHRYLAEQAAARCDWLHLFVVREDASFFPFEERWEMVCRGVAHLPNVIVHRGSDYLISRATFPGYFLKESGLIDKTWSAMDLMIFRDYIAPALGITHRFVGNEPFCAVTREYNQAMRYWLEVHRNHSAASLQVVELPRKCHAAGRAISASEVRALLKSQQMARIREIVPETTFSHLRRYYALDVA